MPYYHGGNDLKSEGTFVHIGATDISVSEETLRVALQRQLSRSYDSTVSLRQDLTFDFTKIVFSKNGLELDREHMKTLHMVDNGKITNLAFMLSDQFDVPVKAALFQDEFKDTFLDRAEFDGSVLEQFDGIMRFITGHNTKNPSSKG